MVFMVAAAGGQTAFAATQGDYGPSSSATLKITLRILPDGAAQRSADSGHLALQDFCGSTTGFDRVGGLFTASLADQQVRYGLPTDDFLRAKCQGEALPRLAAGTSSPADQLTVVIAPI